MKREETRVHPDGVKTKVVIDTERGLVQGWCADCREHVLVDEGCQSGLLRFALAHDHELLLCRKCREARIREGKTLDVTEASHFTCYIQAKSLYEMLGMEPPQDLRRFVHTEKGTAQRVEV